jgi:thiosulfate/3-mercaptopyruvate sulfurtransferase
MRSVIKNYMGMIAIAIVAVLVVGALAVRIDRSQTPDKVQGIPATPAIRGNAPNMLVDARWVLQFGGQVDYLYDLGDARQYEEGHIPGAQHLHWQDAMRLHTANYGEPDAISNETAPGDVFGNLHLNVPQDARIVLYDSNNSERAAWLLWVMTINGYTDVHVLDGGLQAWIGAGGDLQTEGVPAPADTLVATPTWNEDVIIRREPLLERLNEPDLRLVDTRTAEQLRDTVNGTIREGHIPGSVNITNADVQRADGTFKSPGELRDLFVSYGINPNDDVVVYSLFSIDSGPVWLAFELANYDNVRVYQEGYVAWGFDADLPISTEPYSAPVAATPAASPAASPVASPQPVTSASSPAATPEDGPTDLTGD